MWENEEEDGETGLLHFSIFAYPSPPLVRSPLHPAPVSLLRVGPSASP